MDLPAGTCTGSNGACSPPHKIEVGTEGGVEAEIYGVRLASDYHTQRPRDVRAYQWLATGGWDWLQTLEYPSDGNCGDGTESCDPTPADSRSYLDVTWTIPQTTTRLRIQVNSIWPDNSATALEIPFELIAVRQLCASPLPCLLYTSPSPRDRQKSRMPSSA